MAANLHTISSSLPPPPSSPTNYPPKSPRATPEARARIVLLLSKLAIHYYRPDFTEGQARQLIADLTDDLEEFPVSEVETAIRLYRQDAKNKYFPTSGALRGIILAARRERADMDSRPKRVVPLCRPSRWHDWPKSRWDASWLETEVPDGELIQDEPGSVYRQPRRAC